MTVATGDEVQVVTVALATGGTFTLTFSGQTTAGIAFDASAATVKTALVALSNIDTNDVNVTGSAGGPWTVTFKGALTDTNVPAMTASAASLTAGGGDTATAVVTTSSQGNPPAGEIVYVDVSVTGGVVANQEVLYGQTPPPGKAVVSKHDYYN